MQKPKLLYNCQNKLDAYYLKNIIQKIATIPVLIVKKKKELQLFVESSNFYKASMILVNHKTVLPSIVKSKHNFFIGINDETKSSMSVIKNKIHKLEEHLLNMFSSNYQQPNKTSLESIRVTSQDTYSGKYNENKNHPFLPHK